MVNSEMKTKAPFYSQSWICEGKKITDMEVIQGKKGKTQI